ncbi:MAG: hypothetical protein HQL27_08105 [Candidatus Omnitrophica bacterium]|nr:hypothetical protein [Candidatus Omnitrophota bacterium]
MPSLEQEIKETHMGAPHIVILGAGASLAACPKGDKEGNPLPLMNNLISILNLKKILNDYKIDYSSNNFEEIYSNICEDYKHAELVTIIENRVKNYFARLSLPNYPTIYDHLVLSLRNKDVIATFNWDPFLYTAWRRNFKIASLPHILHLHGSIAMGYCPKDRMKGYLYGRCSKCGERYVPSQLLFPIKKKNYTDNVFISSEWETLKNCLKHAYILTIFGYSAPASDIEAISLMKEGWGPAPNRSLEEIEIIDIKSSPILAEAWKDFICSHHYRTTNNFYNSYITQHPRRTCEAMWSSLMMCDPYNDNYIPKNFTFEELYKWYDPLIKAEIKKT